MYLDHKNVKGTLPFKNTHKRVLTEARGRLCYDEPREAQGPGGPVGAGVQRVLQASVGPRPVVAYPPRDNTAEEEDAGEQGTAHHRPLQQSQMSGGLL